METQYEIYLLILLLFSVIFCYLETPVCVSANHYSIFCSKKQDYGNVYCRSTTREPICMSEKLPAVDLGIVGIQLGMQTMLGDQWHKISGVRSTKQQQSEDGTLRHHELDAVMC